MQTAVARVQAVTEIEAVLPCGPCPARTCGVCSAVATPDIGRLANSARVVDVPRGQTFIHENAPANYFYILIIGSARLYKLLPDGRRQIVGFRYAGSFLGLAACENYAFSAEAIEPVQLCFISRRRFQTTMNDCSAVAQRVLDIAVTDLIQAQEHTLLLGQMTAIQRMASFLLLQIQRLQSCGVGQRRIRLPMSRIDIADYLGLTVETVSRSIAQLKNRGLIAVPSICEMIILDPVGLEALAQGC